MPKPRQSVLILIDASLSPRLSRYSKLASLDASPLEPGAHHQMKAPGSLWGRDKIIVGLLAPDIQKALLLGTAPARLDPDKLSARDMPLDWDDQRRFLGFAAG